jgi:hypothetical protein
MKPNRWKLEDAEDNSIINYYTNEVKADEDFCRFDLANRSIILYSCYENEAKGELSEWKIENFTNFS